MEPLTAYIGVFHVPVSETLLRLFAAAGFAFLLGLDREIRQKAFGLRTHMLLCVGTAAFVLILLEMTYSTGNRSTLIEFDPGRVIQGVIIGIGFLGAGAIFRAERQVIGATTGAGIWVLGGIGLACGLGLYLHAGMITAIVILIVTALHPFDEWLERKVEKHSKEV